MVCWRFSFTEEVELTPIEGVLDEPVGEKPEVASEKTEERECFLLMVF